MNPSRVRILHFAMFIALMFTNPMSLHALEPAVALDASSLKLHVPSPDWRDQIIYFVMTDRFNDGDASNNDQGAKEYDPANVAKYSGGDFKGLTNKLDYIQGLGATALWITPPVANVWWDEGAQYGGYHGYWAEHFMKLDKHLGTLRDYQHLAHTLHSKGMYLIQDVVVNHTGNFFSIKPNTKNDKTGAAQRYSLRKGMTPVSAPSQPPFNLNDVRRAEDARANIYHWTPDVTDYLKREQELNYQMSGLDDLNTENPVVRDALRESYGYWIREVGVDAFRVDTAFFAPPDYFTDFLYSNDQRHPGMMRIAAQTGRKQFHVFGEGFRIGTPYSDKAAKDITRYIKGKQGNPLMPGMLNFPLYGALNDVFARGHPTAELAHRIAQLQRDFPNPHLMVNFVDNHDVDRFLAGSTEVPLQQALLAMMTLPGIPAIYYGTEQGFKDTRAAMFKTGYKSTGKDHFDVSAPLYRYLQRITALRKNHRVFSRGQAEVLQANAAQAGVLAYWMRHEGQAALIAFNTMDTPVLMSSPAISIANGSILKGVFDRELEKTEDLLVDAQGRISTVLPARAARVWLVEASDAKQKTATSTIASQTRLSLQEPKALNVKHDFSVTVNASQLNPDDELLLVVDGNLSAAIRAKQSANDSWSATIKTDSFIDAKLTHQLVAYAPKSGAVSQATEFRVTPQWQLVAEVNDPLGDDKGREGKYAYPTDSTYGKNRQMDIRKLKVWRVGSALKLDLTMQGITRSWNPPNGFDHVAFTIYIELPAREGGTNIMPLQRALLPEGMKWHYRLRAHGWTNAFYTSEGASETHEGTPAPRSAHISVNAATRNISFTLPADAFGKGVSLKGAKIYVTTWDYDNGYRPLTLQPAPFSIGGGDPKTGALIMDDTPVITLQ